MRDRDGLAGDEACSDWSPSSLVGRAVRPYLEGACPRGEPGPSFGDRARQGETQPSWRGSPPALMSRTVCAVPRWYGSQTPLGRTSFQTFPVFPVGPVRSVPSTYTSPAESCPNPRTKCSIRPVGLGATRSSWICQSPLFLDLATRSVPSGFPNDVLQSPKTYRPRSWGSVEDR